MKAYRVTFIESGGLHTTAKRVKIVLGDASNKTDVINQIAREYGDVEITAIREGRL